MARRQSVALRRLTGAADAGRLCARPRAISGADQADIETAMLELVRNAPRERLAISRRGGARRRKFLSGEAMAAIERGLAALGRSAVEQPSPPVLHAPGGGFFQPLVAASPIRKRRLRELADVSSGQSGRTVRSHSGGILVLNDFSTGAPLCLMDGIWISHRRTGYMAGLAAKYLPGTDRT